MSSTLRHGGDDLVPKGDVGNLLVVLGDAEIAQIRTEAKASEQFLLEVTR